MPNRPRHRREETVAEFRVCPRCGTQVPLQKSGAAVGIRPCPGCGRPISVRSQHSSDNFIEDAFVDSDPDHDLEPDLAESPAADDVTAEGFETVPWPKGQSRGAKDEPTEVTTSRRRGQWWIPLLTFVTACVAIFGGMLLVGSLFSVPVDDNLGKVGRAVQNYIEKNNGKLPHADQGPKGETGLSWRVHLLPYFDDPKLQALYNEFHLDEKWDSPHNLQLLERMPAVYRSPDVFRPSLTSLHFFTGVETPLGGPQALPVNACVDGRANTILAVYAGKEMAEEWTSPGGVLLTPDPLTNLGSPVARGFPVVMLDGKVRRLPYNLDPNFARALILHDDMMQIDVQELDREPADATLPPGVRPPSPNVQPGPIRYRPGQAIPPNRPNTPNTSPTKKR